MKKNDQPVRVDTIIEGTTNKDIILKAVQSYIDGISLLAHNEQNVTNFLSPLVPKTMPLKNIFKKRIESVAPIIIDIIAEVNDRSQVLRSEAYRSLKNKDVLLWNKATGNNSYEKFVPIFGVLACVDRGIPSEAVVGLDGDIGRTLAGDISIAYIPSKNKFIARESYLLKRFIHIGRQDRDMRTLVEPMLVHTNCGRLGQMLANEKGTANIPSLGYVFDNINALTNEFDGDQLKNQHKINQIHDLWNSLDRSGLAVTTPDGGLYAGVVMKIAERQALKNSLEGYIKALIMPIEIYDKRNGNLIVGVDKVDSLTHPEVLKNKGFTDEVVEKLSRKKFVFSLKTYSEQIFKLLQLKSSVKKGSRTYTELQKNWFTVQSELVEIVTSLWKLYEAKNKTILPLVQHYLQATGVAQLNTRRLIHHLFHVTAYAYIFDTLKRGNTPGNHIEDHLAIGDDDIGAKLHMPLGQGDLDRPSVSEMFTGYSVLLHSTPGKNSLPVVAMIKLDTDRGEHQPMSTEETNVAIEDFKEFLKLWPYFLVGDIIPVLAVRGKRKGGISRLGLSVILSFGDIVDLFEQSESPLPDFVPASSSKGEVVWVPATAVLNAGVDAGDNLDKFRALVKTVADQFADSPIQRSFSSSVRK